MFDSVKKKLNKRGTKAFQKSEANTSHDWVIALEIFIVATLVFIGINTYLYFGVDVDDVFLIGGSDVETDLIVDQELLDQTIESFEEKAKAHDAYNRTAPVVPGV